MSFLGRIKYFSSLISIKILCNNFKICPRKCLVTKPLCFYSILGLKSDASEAEIKEAYYALSKIYHPDRNMGDESALSRILKINEAFEVLGNTVEREKYNKKMYPEIKPRKYSDFIYEDNDYYDVQKEVRSRIYRKPDPNMNCTMSQFKKHSKGEWKRKQKHQRMQYAFNQSQSSKFWAHIKK